ncbi:PQQ-binding-like beta-propeller repeat protein [Symmachiella dynata]|uniref:outer membrane protein assembly factor BamB family protein n=1 Tax=Symmachiella dynata TaxID=2527995 RepID=UPI001E345113|nr:PQQ-binding-like beta-propeller repeat protein [Symmachiella dynata]
MSWEIKLAQPALGGIAATESFVIFGSRSLDDRKDLFQCYDTLAGLKLWELEYAAEGELDYGISPRTTPLIYGDLVFLFGALGDLHCVDLLSGEVQWKTNVRKAFVATAEMPWGYCGSPLLVDGKLIINPGAANASLVALNPKTGQVLWKSPGKASGYGSLIAGRFGGKLQIVGHDADSLGGWDPNTGKRLWTLKPPQENDFNVPTPINVDGQLLVSTENNGTRLYRFKDNGEIDPKPVAENAQLNPDTSSPVVVGDRLFCVHYVLWCLNANGKLERIWRLRDAALSKHGVIIASSDRLLVIGDGELLLLDPLADKPRIISRVKIFEDKVPPYSHPALVGTKLFIRSENRLKCLDLSN